MGHAYLGGTSFCWFRKIGLSHLQQAAGTGATWRSQFTTLCSCQGLSRGKPEWPTVGRAVGCQQKHNWIEAGRWQAALAVLSAAPALAVRPNAWKLRLVNEWTVKHSRTLEARKKYCKCSTCAPAITCNHLHSFFGYIQLSVDWWLVNKLRNLPTTRPLAPVRKVGWQNMS